MFDWDRFLKGKVAVCCNSLEEYKWFMEYIESHGVVHTEKANMRSYIDDSNIDVVGLSDFIARPRDSINGAYLAYYMSYPLRTEESWQASEVLAGSGIDEYRFDDDEFFEMINGE